MKINFNPTAAHFGAKFFTKPAPAEEFPSIGRGSYCCDAIAFYNKYYPKTRKLMEQGNIKEVFETFGIKCNKLPDGKRLIIQEYRQPNRTSTFADLEIDEDKLLENVVGVVGDMNFDRSKATSVKNLKSIGGHLKAVGLKRDIDFSSLTSVGTNLDISGSKIQAMPKLKYIGSWAYFDGSAISNLDSLETVKSWLSLDGTNVTELPSIDYIGRDYTPSRKMSINEAARIKSKEHNTHLVDAAN